MSSLSENKSHPIDSDQTDLFLEEMPRSHRPWTHIKKRLSAILPDHQVREIQNLFQPIGRLIGIELHDPSDPGDSGRINFLISDKGAIPSLRRLDHLVLDGVRRRITWAVISNRPRANAGGGRLGIDSGSGTHATATARVTRDGQDFLLTIGHAHVDQPGTALHWSDDSPKAFSLSVTETCLHPERPIDASLVAMSPATASDYPVSRSPGVTRTAAAVDKKESLSAWYRSHGSWSPATVRSRLSSVALSVPGRMPLIYRRVVTCDVETMPSAGDCGGPYVSNDALVGMHLGYAPEYLRDNGKWLAVMLPVAPPFDEWNLSLAAV